ncbi:MAG: peptidase dimerization domain-containing protein [Spirochaetaceae bacterium]|jgi:amidohydrolase|nr:peptidase dimerization domain-containing protein [Spirochaetaceae bacterium]
MLNDNIRSNIDKYFDTAKTLAAYITNNPELSGAEHLAIAAYKQLLNDGGFEFVSPFGGLETAFLAIDARKKDFSKKAVLLCEYDALPIGHACGHSISGTASVLAALALRDAFPDMSLRIDLMGTPAEETTGGKADLIKAGVFEGYDFAAMVHMSNANRPLFKVLACNDRYYTWTGKAAHASIAPEEGINALNAGRLYLDAMDMQRQHLKPGMQFHGIIAHGGEAPNIVPERCELNMYFRGLSLADLHSLNETSDRIAKAAATAIGCTVNIEQRINDFADMRTTENSNKLVCSIFDDMKLSYTEMNKPQGSSDAGNVSYVIPTYQPMIAITDDASADLHTQAFLECVQSDAGRERGLRNGAMVLAELCYRLGAEEK